MRRRMPGTVDGRVTVEALEGQLVTAGAIRHIEMGEGGGHS